MPKISMILLEDNLLRKKQIFNLIGCFFMNNSTFSSVKICAICGTNLSSGFCRFHFNKNIKQQTSRSIAQNIDPRERISDHDVH